MLRKNPIFDVGLQNYLREREKRRAIHIDSSASSQDSTDLAFALSQPSDISSKGSTFNYLSPLVSKNIQLSSDPDFMSFSQPPMQEPKCSPGKVFAPFTYALDHVLNNNVVHFCHLLKHILSLD